VCERERVREREKERERERERAKERERERLVDRARSDFAKNCSHSALPVSVVAAHTTPGGARVSGFLEINKQRPRIFAIEGVGDFIKHENTL